MKNITIKLLILIVIAGCNTNDPEPTNNNTNDIYHIWNAIRYTNYYDTVPGSVYTFPGVTWKITKASICYTWPTYTSCYPAYSNDTLIVVTLDHSDPHFKILEVTDHSMKLDEYGSPSHKIYEFTR